ncbi:MAG: BrnT family toxin, partial [Beijerinckiaceae bacterium]
MFEWDDEKARQNLVKHGVTFDEAKAVFSDPFAYIRYDERFDYGEDRFFVIGMSVAKVLYIIAVERD